MIYETALSLRLAADRRRFVADLIKAVETVEGAKLTLMSWRNADGSLSSKAGSKVCRLDFAVPGKLSVSLTVDARYDVPTLHWYGALEPLQGVYGAWASHHVNQFHGCKATSFPPSLSRVIDSVVRGLTAAADGSAFKGEAA